MSLASDGSLIVATGSAANPYLAWLRAPSGEIRRLAEIRGPVRYPAVSPDGKRLAFSRRESGAWHLFLRDFDSGRERQLTSAACNATSPSWEDDENLLYVSDCGRGLGFGAPARVVLPPTAKDAPHGH
jgi:Tol biopolymer transport system component